MKVPAGLPFAVLLVAACLQVMQGADSGYPYYEDEGALYNETYADMYYDSTASSIASGIASRHTLSDEQAAWSIKVPRSASDETGDGHSDRQVTGGHEDLDMADSIAAAPDSYSAELGYDDEELAEAYEDARSYGGLDEGAEYDPLYVWDTCIDDGSGQPTVNGTEQCNLMLRGVDAQSDRLVGGLDGLYQLTGCHEGKPMYVRMDGPPNEERSLFFNSLYGDWEIAVGRAPTDDQLLMYSDPGFVSPLDVPAWHLAAALNTEEAQLMPSPDEDLYFIALDVTVLCAPVARTHSAKEEL